MHKNAQKILAKLYRKLYYTSQGLILEIFFLILAIETIILVIKILILVIGTSTKVQNAQLSTAQSILQLCKAYKKLLIFSRGYDNVKCVRDNRCTVISIIKFKGG